MLKAADIARTDVFVLGDSPGDERDHRAAQVLDWQDWWATPDQQAAAVHLSSVRSSLFDNNTTVDPDLLRKLDAWPQWQAIVLIHSGKHAQAAQLLARVDSATAHYNRSNALTHAGDFQEALQAYNQALAIDPELHDALFNRALVREAPAR